MGGTYGYVHVNRYKCPCRILPLADEASLCRLRQQNIMNAEQRTGLWPGSSRKVINELD